MQTGTVLTPTALMLSGLLVLAGAGIGNSTDKRKFSKTSVLVSVSRARGSGRCWSRGRKAMSRPITIMRIQSTSMNDDPYITVQCLTSEGTIQALPDVGQRQTQREANYDVCETA